MPASFLHGIETIEISTGPVPITVVKSAVIGLVGSAPLWAAVGAPAMWQPNKRDGVRSASGRPQRQHPAVLHRRHHRRGRADLGDHAQRHHRRRHRGLETRHRRRDSVADAHAGEFHRQPEYRRLGRRLRAADAGLHRSLRARGDPGPGRRPGYRGQRLQSLPPLHRHHGPGDGDAGVGAAGAQPGAHGRLERDSQELRRFHYLYQRD